MTNEELDDLMKMQIDTTLSAEMYKNRSSSQIGTISAANPTMGYITGASGTGASISGGNPLKSRVEEKVEALTDSIAAIEKRLAILVPDPTKLEHFAALRKAYDHYKMIEAMCQMPEKNNGG